MVRALRMGGDTDTIAAMTGALAGARYGYRRIPELWHQVEGRGRLMQPADTMFMWRQ